MLKKIALALAALIVVFLLLVWSRPGSFHVERSVTIAASPAAIYGHLDDFHAWAAWSPYEGRDPNIQKQFEGPERGEGASYHWAGNDAVGEGRMTITGAQPPSHLTIKLDFIKPWQGTSVANFTVAASHDVSLVTWAMDSESNFFHKAASIFLDLDKMIGKDFEEGLAKLKSVSERTP